MIEYVCIEGFSVEMCDDDGWITDDYLDIEVGEKYKVNDTPFRVAGGPETIRLESENGNWLEVTKETIERYFEPLQED